MGRTNIRSTQLRDRDLTGASFDNELLFYDETKSYAAGDIVFYAGKFYKLKNDIPATSEGDLQYSPTNQPDNWEDITYNLLFKQRDINIQNAGDVYTIQLENPNSDFKKSCFILKYNAPQTNQQNTIANFDENEGIWNYDNEWVSVDGALRLKTSKSYPMTKYDNGNIEMYTRTINSNDYEDMESITITVEN